MLNLISSNKVKSYLGMLFNQMYATDVVFNPNMSVCDGRNVFIYKDNSNYIEIGSRELDSKPFVSIQTFVSSFVTTYHEMKHSYQLQDCINGNNLVDNRIVINSLACEYNNNYYWSTYKDNVREIEAEVYGILNTRDFLINYVDGFDENKADKYLLNYAKHRFMDNHPLYSYVDDVLSMSSVDELLTGFSNAYDICNVYGNNIGNKSYYHIQLGKDNGDIAGAYMMRHKDIFDEFCNAKTMYDRDYIVAKINLIKHPELFDLYGKNDIIKKLRSEIRDLPEIEDDVSYENELKYND